MPKTAKPPRSEPELMSRACLLEGMSLQQLARQLDVNLAEKINSNKGLIGFMLERFLGASAASLAEPDFVHIGVELKSIPMKRNGIPAESTFISHVPLQMERWPTWEESSVCKKLRRVLWIPVEASGSAPLRHLRIGGPILWSPQGDVLRQLRADWEELSELICLGRIEEIDSSMGEYLQIRPKAIHARSLAPYVDTDGRPSQTLPRGFYLRAAFTRRFVFGNPRAQDAPEDTPNDVSDEMSDKMSDKTSRDTPA